MDDETMMALFVEPIIDYAENYEEKPLSDKKMPLPTKNNRKTRDLKEIWTSLWNKKIK